MESGIWQLIDGRMNRIEGRVEKVETELEQVPVLRKEVSLLRQALDRFTVALYTVAGTVIAGLILFYLTQKGVV